MPGLLIIMLAVTMMISGCQTQNPPSEAVTQPQNADFALPAGDPEMGRQTFMELRCNVCHRVMFQGLPVPTAPNQGPMLTMDHAAWSNARLVTAIIAPSHSLSPEWKNVPGGVSPMGDYDNVMTVRQLIDIVAFIHSIH